MRQADRIALDLPADMAYVHVPGACLTSLLEGSEGPAGPADTVYGMELAVYELCTNIVTHAYGDQVCGDEACRFQVVFTLAPQRTDVIIDLYDTGCSFDPAQVPEPDVSQPQTQGYGLYLVRQLADDVTYEVEPERNHWRLTKKL